MFLNDLLVSLRFCSGFYFWDKTLTKNNLGKNDYLDYNLIVSTILMLCVYSQEQRKKLIPIAQLTFSTLKQCRIPCLGNGATQSGQVNISM